MRVGIHIDPAMHAIPGGVGAYVRRLVDHLLLVRSGHELVGLVSLRAELPRGWALYPIVRTPLPVLPLYAAWNFAAMPRVRGRFDVVHATNLVNPPAKRAALVATVHDLAVERMPEVVPGLWRTIYRRGLRVAVRRAAVICAVSETTRDDLVEHYSIDPERIVVTWQGPNVTPESPRNENVMRRLGLTGPYALAVGTIEPRKNHIGLLRAFGEAAAELDGFKLVIAGASGWGRDAVDETITKLRLADRVVLAGKVTDAEMASLYANASVFAQPSLYEGFGIPLVEAMSFGVPSVASMTPALTEVAGGAALQVEATDAAGLSDALVALGTDDDLRSRLAERGRARAAEFSWERTAASTVQAYERAAAG